MPERSAGGYLAPLERRSGLLQQRLERTEVGLDFNPDYTQ